jgi:hypothetical protein
LAKLTVLGQIFTSNAETFADVGLGDYVAVASSGDQVTSLIYSVGSAYVPGVSLVTVRGVVGTVDAARATATVGDVVVDYSAQLAIAPDYIPQIGEMFEATGTQPLPHGAVLVGTADGALVTQLGIRSFTNEASSGASGELDNRS